MAPAAAQILSHLGHIADRFSAPMLVVALVFGLGGVGRGMVRLMYRFGILYEY